MDNQIVMTKKEKYQLEFEVRSSTKILFNHLSTSSGLSEWFADKVDDFDGVFSFKWEGSAAKAKLISKKDLQFVRFKWLDEEDDSYFQFDIVKDELTSDIALVVTDFSIKEDMDENKRLWDSQIHELMHAIGS